MRRLLVLFPLFLLASSSSAAWSDQKGEYQFWTKNFILNPRALWDLAMGDWLLMFLIILIGILFCSSVFFFIIATSLRRDNTNKAKRWTMLEKEWESKIISVLNGERKPEAIWEIVRTKDRLYFIDYLMRFARRFRGEEREIIAQLALPFLGEIAKHLKSDSSAQRARAVQALGYLGFQFYVGELIKALDDKSPLVAMIAARALARKEHPQYIELVLDRMYRFEHWSPKFLATMLVSVGSEALPFLRKTYADNSKPGSVRAIAAEALRELNDLSSAAIAHSILQEEIVSPHPMKDRCAVRDAKRATVRREIRPDRESEAMLDERDEHVHPERDLFASSIRILRSYGSPEHTDAVRALTDSLDFVIRAFALRALGTLGSGEDIPRLRLAMNDPSIWVTIHAARALCELGDESRLVEIAESDHRRMYVARQVLAEAAA